MPGSKIEPDEISQRLWKLESDNQRLKRLAVVGAILSVIPTFLLLSINARSSLAQEPQSGLRTITAYQYILRDSAGRMRAELGFSDIHGSPMLAFFGPGGRVRCQIWADGTTTSIMTYSPDGGSFQTKLAATGDGAIIQAGSFSRGTPQGNASLFAFKHSTQLVAEGADRLRTIVGKASFVNPKTGKVDHTSTASVVMLNGRGHLIWEAAPKSR